MRWIIQVLTAVFAICAASVAGQELSGRFYPEKHDYLVGEPIYVAFDLANEGAEPIRTTNGSCWIYLRFEAPTASRPRTVSLFGCTGGGVAGDCGESAFALKPGDHLRQRFLLDGPFRLDSPGSFPIRAKTTITIYANDDSYTILGQREITSEFEVSLELGDEQALMKAYEPILRELRGDDAERRSLAIQAIMQSPPLFLEREILNLADNPQTSTASVGGLQRLGTKAAKDKLLELASRETQEYLIQPAIQAIAETGDPVYCSPMLDLAQHSPGYSRMVALRGAGYLCGERALPLLLGLLGTSDRNLRFELAYALGNSHTRKAIPVLVDLLTDSNENVRRAASEALTTLAHRHSHPGVASPQDAEKARQDWASWWVGQGQTSEIFSPKDCASFQSD